MSRLKKRRNRRKLYAGGALMVLAPMGVAGCGADQNDPVDAVDVGPVDVVSEAPDGYVDPDVIAIAPFDPGVLDLDVPELIAIAPTDLGPPDVVAIAPFDPGPADPGPPDVIAIAPFDPGPADPGSSDVAKPGDPCFPEGSLCSDTLVCQPQAICIVATDCCGGCACEEVPCNPANPWCPPGMECTKVDGEDICVSKPPASHPGGFMEPCQANEECLQEYFCEQTMFCIAPPPGDGEAPADNPCNQKNCVPMACYGPDKNECPDGSLCLPYGGDDLIPNTLKTCVRQDPGAGGYGADCTNGKSCLSDQYFCQDIPIICILPCGPQSMCLPKPCDIVKPDCPPDSACVNVGITDACVKK